jgi:serine/threonine protein kinase
MDLFFSTLESVLNINSEMAKRLVTEFNGGDLPFFEAYFNALPTAKLMSSNAKNGSVDYTLFIDEASIGEGGYGTIYKNRVRPYVYKTIEDYERVNNKNSLLYLKTNFKEVIIQALLQSDDTYGKHVCRIYKVYKTANNFIFQIEPLEIALDKYIFKHHTEDHLYETMPRVLLKLVEILNYFYVKYGFNHNDMSTSNVMTVKDGDIVGNVKLIDFETSYISKNLYRNIKQNTYGLAGIYNVSSMTEGTGYYFLLVRTLNIASNSQNFSNLVEQIQKKLIDCPSNSCKNVYTECEKLLSDELQKGGKRKSVRKALRKRRLTARR